MPSRSCTMSRPPRSGLLSGESSMEDEMRMSADVLYQTRRQEEGLRPIDRRPRRFGRCQQGESKRLESSMQTLTEPPQIGFI